MKKHVSFRCPKEIVDAVLADKQLGEDSTTVYIRALRTYAENLKRRKRRNGKGKK